jgi:hypothetical protein
MKANGSSFLFMNPDERTQAPKKSALITFTPALCSTIAPTFAQSEQFDLI